MYGQPTVHNAFLQGRAVGVGREIVDEVEGFYDISTIIGWMGRAETVAFKTSGIGPEQISEPASVKTLRMSLV
jgi:hypothetical protein